MQSTLKTLLLAGAASFAIALGAASAQAGDLDASTLIDAMTSSDEVSDLTDALPTPIKDAVAAAATEAAVESLLEGLDD